MSDIQQFLALMADALHIGALGEEGCADLAKALNGVPAEYHAAAFKAFLCGEDEAQEAPEDYAAVKTFDSSEFHVGDEILGYSGRKYIVLYVDKLSLAVIGDDMTVRNLDKSPNSIKRTGRNFPAIAAILDKIRK